MLTIVLCLFCLVAGYFVGANNPYTAARLKALVLADLEAKAASILNPPTK